MLVFAAIGVFGAGMLAIAAGIPIKEFGFGNTLILSGVLAWCTSAIMVTLWVCSRDLKQALEKSSRGARTGETETPAPRPAASEMSPHPANPASPSGWPESIPERAPATPPPAPLPPPPAEARAPRRNILFASNRKPRDASPNDAMPSSDGLIGAAPSAGPLELRPPVAAEEPRPAPRRIESPPPPQRTVRPVSTINPRDPVTAPPAPSSSAPLPSAPLPPASPAQETPSAPPRDAEPAGPLRNPPARVDTNLAVSVLKSGVVDGMAYWLYSDGSIEAQMPEGMMRFTSIDELRAHLDKRA